MNPWPQTTVQITSTVNPTTQFTGNLFNYQTQVGEVLTLTPMGPPVSAPATPSWLGATANNGQIILKWTASTAASGYNVMRSTDGNNFVVIATNVPGTIYTDSSLNNGPSYYYEITAVNSFGANSNTAPVFGSLAPATPSWQSVILGSQQLALSWTASPGATGYNLKRSSDGNSYSVIATNLSVTNFTDSTVNYGATYYYEVSALNSFGESLNSAPFGLTVITPPTRIPAANYSSQSGIQTESCSEGGLDVGYINSGDWCIYNGLNFGPGTLRLNARVASGGSGGTIEVRLGATNGTLAGALTVPVTGSWQTWTTVSTALTNVSGLQNLVLRFVGGSGYLFNVEWIAFTPISMLPTQLGWQFNARQFQFTWPADHTGWRLQAQTNAPGAGLGTNWATVSGSTGTNAIAVPVGNTNGSVFFRLVSP
jgi:fibronectin type 3 domain-containing protein